ncbi:HD family phosphohydrolase [Priestia abyssalis]|uniref:HD family phosphohydrolase n=1 Tax=Priestia abyssalis TaxID=1221450 RepID=UPI0038B6B0D0
MDRFKLVHIGLYTLLGIIMYAMMYSNIKPEELDLRLFSVSPQTVYSPIAVEDKESTEKKRKEAEDAVKDVYTLKTDYAQNRVDLAGSIFDFILEVNNEIAESPEQETWTAEERLKKQQKILNEKLPSNIGKSLSEETISQLLQANREELKIAKDAVVTAVHSVMKDRITVSDVESKKKQVQNQLIYTNVSNELKKAMYDVAQFAIIPNVVYDPNKTAENRQEAGERIEPVRIKQGQMIVEEGQLITTDIYRQLKLVGLLDRDHAVQPLVGLLLLIVIMISFVMHYVKGLTVNADRSLLLYVIVFTVTILIMKILSLFQGIEISEIGFLAPVAAGGLLIRMLLNERLAVISSIMLSICGSVIFNGGVTTAFNVYVGIYLLVSSLAGVLFLSQQHRRSKILQAGLFISFVNIIVILSILLIKNGHFDSVELSYYGLMGIASGVIAAVLTIGLLPFFEAGFGILSTMKLIELSNPNHPLLRKILTETPGTYHHSVMVANLSDSACEAIGANGLLARVGAYYHDIGKTRRPQYFIENQLGGKNPHDKLAPEVSKNIIIAHATEGADILRKHKLPKEIVDIAEQHHGTTLLKYFYHKALEQADADVAESDYRYPGPKAQTKESAVVGIADSVEAAVRSLPNPTPEKIEALVRNIIKDRLQDEQFNECDITLKELELVATNLCETLNGIFHSRIEYPELKKEKVKEHVGH